MSSGYFFSPTYNLSHYFLLIVSKTNTCGWSNCTERLFPLMVVRDGTAATHQHATATKGVLCNEQISSSLTGVQWPWWGQACCPNSLTTFINSNFDNHWFSSLSFRRCTGKQCSPLWSCRVHHLVLRRTKHLVPLKKVLVWNNNSKIASWSHLNDYSNIHSLNS